MTPRNIITKASALQDEFNKLKSRVEYWNSSGFTAITRILDSFSKEPHGLKCDVVQSPEVKSVNLRLADGPTANSDTIIRQGGALHYLLNHRGKVLAVVTFPFVAGQLEQAQSVVIGDAGFEPEDISKDLIWGHIEKFLDEILKWESNKSYPIGFRIEGGKVVIPEPKESNSNLGKAKV